MFFEPIRFGGRSAAATTAPTNSVPVTSPKSAVRLLLSAAIFMGASLGQVHAAATQASASVELEGEVRVMIEDSENSSRTRYYLKTDKGSLELKPVRGQERDLKPGARVRVRGVKSGEMLALDGTTTTVSAPAPTLNISGDRKLAVLLVNFQDNPVQPYTLADGTNVLNQTSNFIKENSQSKTTVSGAAFGWYTLPIATTCSDTSITSAAKQAAAAAGVDLSGYAHIAYVFPRNTACPWAGVANLSGQTIMINGSLNLKTLAHELGHNFGLYHSHALECGASIGGTGCTSLDYGDALDMMGNANPGHYNAFQKERLGWLNNGTTPPITTVSSSGTYTLSTYETTATGAKALKILKSTDATTGAKTYYYVEFRQPVGADAFISTMVSTYGSNVDRGVIVRTGTENNGSSSYLLDMTPASTTFDWYDSALALGQSFSDPGSGVTITPTWVNSTGAGVNVTVNAQTTTVATTTCTRANPVITPATQSKSGTSGSSLSYTVTVTNKDSSGCSASSFSLKSVVPSGWSASFASASLSLSPGASASTTLTMSSPTSASGSTNASLSATNTGVTTSVGSATATYSVGSTTSSYTVTATTDKSLYSVNKTALMSSVVKSGTAAVSGASVMFTVTAPNGSVALQNASTSSTGVASSSYRLSSKAVKGVYQVRTTVSGQSAYGSTSFTVQ